MRQEQWLKPGFVLPDGEQIKTFYVNGSEWQIYTTASGGYALAVRKALFRRWLSRDFVEEGFFLPPDTGSCAESGQCAGDDKSRILVTTVPRGEMISSAEFGPYPVSMHEALPFARALKTAEGKTGGISVADGLFISRFPSLLPTWQDGGTADADVILGRWLSGGVNVPASDGERMKKFAPYLMDTDRCELLRMLDLKEQTSGGQMLHMPSRIDPAWRGGQTGREASKAADTAVKGAVTQRKDRVPGPFVLAGRPELEAFFRDEIIDVVDREEEYRKFGVGFPGPTLLYGPPGSGKTFAVEKLADYLGWPVFQITTGTVGSKYIHETGRRIEEIFDAAIREAPSVLVIDELEAFLSSRADARGSSESHLEEVGVFLRRIPDAAENRVLLFGMTNMYGKIDPAILRRGRFDHRIEVGMPSAGEVLAVLDSSLADLPAEGDLGLPALSERLAGLPFSDVAFVVKEAGRLSVRRGRKAIDAAALREAAAEVKPAEKPKRKFGF